jgi:repressor of nif and glnA expression
MAYNTKGRAKLYTAETSGEIVKFFTQRSEAIRFSKDYDDLTDGNVVVQLSRDDERNFKEVVAELYATRKKSMENYSMRHVIVTMLNQHMDYRAYS